MAPQCGLAPGFVGIVAASQIGKFDMCRSVRLRVGALPQHPTGLLGYAFNWSPEGVVNEYLNDCEVHRGGRAQDRVVDGVEARRSSSTGASSRRSPPRAGSGTMCETYHGVVDNIDYKTIRYPGHMDLMNFFFHELLMRERRELAGRDPHQRQASGRRRRGVRARGLGRGCIGQHCAGTSSSALPAERSAARRTAIAWTTAGSVAAVIEMVRNGTLPVTGFLKQEEVALDAFLDNTDGSSLR